MPETATATPGPTAPTPTIPTPERTTVLDRTTTAVSGRGAKRDETWRTGGGTNAPDGIGCQTDSRPGDAGGGSGVIYPLVGRFDPYGPFAVRLVVSTAVLALFVYGRRRHTWDRNV